MILKYATKRNKYYGYRKFLGIDTEKKTFSTESAHWLCREDFTEIGSRDRSRMIEELKKDGWTETNNI